MVDDMVFARHAIAAATVRKQCRARQNQEDFF